MNLKDNLKKALDLHSHVLHAETQAIAAKDLSTIEDILAKKEESLECLIAAKKLVDDSTESFPELESLVKNVLEHQAKNAENFRKLHVQNGDNAPAIDSSNSLTNRITKAYRR